MVTAPVTNVGFKSIREQPLEDQVMACPLYPVDRIRQLFPEEMLTVMENNQQLKICCRHVDNHLVEARYTSAQQARSGVPDYYIFHCTECGCRHHQAMHGIGDVRPKWIVR